MYTLGHPYFWPIYLHIYTLTYFLFVMYKLQGANKKYAHGIMAFASSPVKYCNQNITQILQFAARIVESSQPLQTCKQMCSAGSLLEDSSCQSCLLLGILWRKKWHSSRGSVRKQIWIWFYVFTFEQLWWLWVDDVAPDVLMLQHISCQPSAYLGFHRDQENRNLISQGAVDAEK